MDELKQLVEMIANLPQLAIWVMAGFWAYKVIFIGSAFGVTRFGIRCLSEYLMAQKHGVPVDRIGAIKDITITSDGTLEELLAQIRRIRGKGVPVPSKYIHDLSVKWLRDAIDAKEQEEAK